MRVFETAFTEFSHLVTEVDDSSKSRQEHGEDDVDTDSITTQACRRKLDRPADVMHACRDCKKEFKRPCDLTKHEKTHSRPWKCTEQDCKYYEFGWPTEKERDRHVHDKHSSSGAQYKCIYASCDYISKRESNCKQHMERYHGWEYVRSKSNGKKSHRSPDSGSQSSRTLTGSNPTTASSTPDVPLVFFTPAESTLPSSSTSGFESIFADNGMPEFNVLPEFDNIPTDEFLLFDVTTFAPDWFFEETVPSTLDPLVPAPLTVGAINDFTESSKYGSQLEKQKDKGYDSLNSRPAESVREKKNGKTVSDIVYPVNTTSVTQKGSEEATGKKPTPQAKLLDTTSGPKRVTQDALHDRYQSNNEKDFLRGDLGIDDRRAKIDRRPDGSPLNDSADDSATHKPSSKRKETVLDASDKNGPPEPVEDLLLDKTGTETQKKRQSALGKEERPAKRQKRPTQKREKRRLMSCIFRKHKPDTYNFSSNKFKTCHTTSHEYVSTLVRHLERYHDAVLCHTCLANFPSREKGNSHKKSRECAPASGSQEEKWHQLYTKLCGDGVRHDPVFESACASSAPTPCTQAGSESKTESPAPSAASSQPKTPQQLETPPQTPEKITQCTNCSLDDNERRMLERFREENVKIRDENSKLLRENNSLLRRLLKWESIYGTDLSVEIME